MPPQPNPCTFSVSAAAAWTPGVLIELGSGWADGPTGSSPHARAADPVVTLPGAGAVRRTESGIGDVVASAFRNVLNERDASFGLDIGTKIKFGTADDSRGLGTGKNEKRRMRN